MKASPEPAGLTDLLARMIAVHGPLSVARYMAEANLHYYRSRDPLGAAGDYTTAPEVSQMFGELIGLWLADLWSRAGNRASRYVELGPGRGTLAADARRAMRTAGLMLAVELVEISPVLRGIQSRRIVDASWHETVDSLPDDVPLLVVANEFFDALPVRQLVATEGGWRERVVVLEEGRVAPGLGPFVESDAVPAPLRRSPPGTIWESSPASLAIVREVAARIHIQGGAALIVDYGHERSSAGETLQAVSRHLYADPWAMPGERDLTAHVDFEALATAAREEGVRILGPRGQGAWLKAIGIDVRAAALAAASPERAEEIHTARDRLVGPDQMGRLFKAMVLVAPGWPEPAGFA